MRRLLAVAFLVVGVFAAAGDPPPPAEQVKALEKDFEKAFEAFAKEYKDAGTPEARKKLVDDKDPVRAYAAKFVALADKLGADPAALTAINWTFENASRAPAVSDAFKLIVRDHLKSEAIADYCILAATDRMPGAEAFLEKVLSDSPHKLVRGAACYGLGQFQLGLAEETPAAAAQHEKKAETYFVQLQAQYADVSVGKDQTLGDVAKGFLYELRELGIGKPMPELISEDLEGKKATLADYRGKVVVIDIWAVWCKNCVAMLPHERALVKRLAGKPFALVSVSFDDTKDDVREFQTKEPMPWPQWYNGPKGPLTDKLHITRFPTVFVIDTKGIIRYKNVRETDLDKAVDSLLAEVK